MFSQDSIVRLTSDTCNDVFEESEILSMVEQISFATVECKVAILKCHGSKYRENFIWKTTLEIIIIYIYIYKYTLCQTFRLHKSANCDGN